MDAAVTTTPTDPTQVALHPVRCIDCDQYVPFGWIVWGHVKCPENFGATGVQYGHRIAATLVQRIQDMAANGTLPTYALEG